MGSYLKVLRLLGDEGRIRILGLLEKEELSVAELQEILGMGQSRISMQLSQLKQAGLLEVRRVGQKSLYHVTATGEAGTLLAETLRRSPKEISAMAGDQEALHLALRKRKDKLRSYFDEVAGRFGRNYVPGRSWQALAEMLLKLMPPLLVADLGAGEGTLALMLAQRARRVIAVDNSEKMVQYGAELARNHGVKNLEYRLGDLEELPLAAGEVDLALFHQSLHHAIHPQKAIAEAWRIVRPGGHIVILDLMKHGFEQARDLYADVWLGFSVLELHNFLAKARFSSVEIAPVPSDQPDPHFETVLAVAEKPSTTPAGKSGSRRHPRFANG
jgi:ubiquinone/menaquinone biosynthesis C-methylase UbiE/DNA-binding HxlR family transcriptional regulator